MLTNLYFSIFQLPQGTQNPDDNLPVDFKDPFDLVVFIILPVLLIVFYFFWKKKRNNRED